MGVGAYVLPCVGGASIANNWLHYTEHLFASMCLTRTPLCYFLQGRGDVDSGQLYTLYSWMRSR